jgi:cytochrome c oxidase subunit 3
MAVETKVETQHHEHASGKDLWSGGHSPFNAPYGKLMMWYFLLSDAFTFAGFLIAYGALRFSMPAWPLPDFVFRTAPFMGHAVLPLVFVTFMTFVLLFSSYTMVRAVQEGHQENQKGVVKWMFLTILGGAAFLGCQAWEWTNLISTENMSIFSNPFSRHTTGGQYLTAEESEVNKIADGLAHDDAHRVSGKSFNFEDPYLIPWDEAYSLTDAGTLTKGYLRREFYVLDENGARIKDENGKDLVEAEPMGPRSFGTLFFFITGFHGFHVLSGVAFLLIVLMNVTSGIYGARKNGYETVEKIGLYWHFVDLVWVFVFLVFYLI